MTTIKDRLTQFIDFKGISKRDFSKKISPSATYFSSTKTFGSDKLEKIANEYPGLNMHWVVTGVGNMFLKPNGKLLLDIIRKSGYTIDELKEKSPYSSSQIDQFVKSEIIEASVFKRIGDSLEIDAIKILNQIADLPKNGKFFEEWETPTYIKNLIQYFEETGKNTIPFQIEIDTEKDIKMTDRIHKMIEEKIQELTAPFKKEITKKTTNKNTDEHNKQP